MKRLSYTKDSPLRISTQEIDEAVKQLEKAYTEGRLDTHEYEKRIDKAFSAKTEGELSYLFTDLPHAVRHAHAYPMRRLSNSSLALFSGFETSGNFIIPKNYKVSAIFGGCHIDLSRAHLESSFTIMKVKAIFGGVHIIVPAGVRIEVQSTPIFGGVSNRVDDEHLPESAPVIRIEVKAIFGGAEIMTKEEYNSYLKK